MQCIRVVHRDFIRFVSFLYAVSRSFMKLEKGNSGRKRRYCHRGFRNTVYKKRNKEIVSGLSFSRLLPDSRKSAELESVFGSSNGGEFARWVWGVYSERVRIDLKVDQV